MKDKDKNIANLSEIKGKEITIQFKDGRKAKIIEVKEIKVQDFINNMSKYIVDLQQQISLLKEKGKDHE